MRMRKIIIAMIENSDNAEDAAEMIIRVFGEPGESEPEAAPAPPAPTKHAGRPKGKAASKKQQSTATPPATSGPPFSSDQINPDEYYSVAVMQHQTGYSPNYIHVMIREDKIVSKMENGRRLILGKDILRMRENRANGAHPQEGASSSSPPPAPAGIA